MAELTVADIVNTQIKLSKKAACYQTANDAFSKKNVWFEKQVGEWGGKLFSWVTKGKQILMMFKTSDDFQNGKSYYIVLEKGLINWQNTRFELILKRQENMTSFDKLVDDIERDLKEYADNIVSNVKSGLIVGGSIAAGILIWKFVIVPEFRFRQTRRLIRTAAQEFKK
jgi:hypothetical protein